VRRDGSIERRRKGIQKLTSLKAFRRLFSSMEERIRMRSSTLKTFFAGLTLLLSAITLSAQAGSTNVPNWTVPPYHAQSSSGGIQTMADISQAAIFVAVTTCRVFDTRDPAGPYGGPRLIANTTRNFDIDSGPCTGIPAGSAAYSMNFGAILPDGANSFITIWPTGAAQPTSSFMNPVFGTVVANAAVVPAGTSGSISVFPNTGVHLYGDINGYFMDEGGNLNPGVRLRVIGDASGSAMIFGTNTNTSSASETMVGVRGNIDTTQNGPSGVRGDSGGATGRNYGVTGISGSGSNGAAGVRALAGSGTFNTSVVDPDLFLPAGVKAVGRNANGINAFASGFRNAGTFITVNDAGAKIAEVELGWNAFGTVAMWAMEGNVIINDDLTVLGATKNFALPHPTDASKQIRYVSVEAPKNEIFFRGSAQVERGITRIDIPDEFRLVAKPGTYSAMVTPVGAMATVAVMAEDADGVVVQASRNVKINYVVYALRDGQENYQAIEPNRYFQPMFEGPYTYSHNEHVLKLMRQNGTLNADGTPNMETVRRLGWTLKPDSENPHRPHPQTE
jgi:hypothetical protein